MFKLLVESFALIVNFTRKTCKFHQNPCKFCKKINASFTKKQKNCYLVQSMTRGFHFPPYLWKAVVCSYNRRHLLLFFYVLGQTSLPQMRNRWSNSNVGPDQDPNCVTLMIFMKDCFKQVLQKKIICSQHNACKLTQHAKSFMTSEEQ